MNRHYSYKYIQLIRTLGGIIILSLAIFLSSCGLPAKTPAIKIVDTTGSVAAGDVTISADLSNFKLVADSKQIRADEGHIVYYMDVPIRTYYDHSAASRAGTCVITNETSYIWKNVTPGVHTFSVQLVRNDDSPLPALAIDTKTINVGPPEGSPEIMLLTPVADSPLPPGNINTSITVNNFIISKKDMGSLNRSGEGHLIYYLDETPPTDAGVPAITDTSVVSTNLHYLWKSVKEGTHTFAVQLVNNDDTPLDTPIFMIVSVIIKP